MEEWRRGRLFRGCPYRAYNLSPIARSLYNVANTKSPISQPYGIPSIATPIATPQPTQRSERAGSAGAPAAIECAPPTTAIGCAYGAAPPCPARGGGAAAAGLRLPACPAEPCHGGDPR